MKKSLLLFLSLFLCQIVFSQASLGSDISIYRDISQSFENKYYPGTIEKVDLLQKKYPDSVFIQPALVYKATALVNLECYEDAIITLKNAIAHMHTGKPEFTQCHYLLGKSNFFLENYDEAIKSFYTACKLTEVDKDFKYYDYSIFYSAESYYKLGNFKDAYPLYEYVIEHGKSFTKDEYEKSLQNLMLSYNKSDLYKKTVKLYDSLQLDFFNDEVLSVLKIYTAEAWEKLGNYNKAYNLYCDVIKSENEDLAIIGLKNSFNLSESKKINVNPGEVFAQSEETFKNNPELVNEFWIRLGIDEYEKKNYEKSLEYFSKCEKELPIINIYKAKIILDNDDTEEGGKKAWKLLHNTNIKSSDVKNISDAYYSLLLQSAVQMEKWNAVPGLFKNIENPDEKTMYIYYSYLYTMENYEKLPPESGVLYASGLCKQGKYKQAVQAFAILDEKGMLEKNLIEYSKALFILEKYDDAYEIAERSSDNQKQYILGLCKFNTKDYEASKNHFNFYIREMSNSDDFNNLAFYYKGYSEYKLKENKNAYASFVRFCDLGAGNEQMKDKILKSSIYISEILTDEENYTKALEILIPFSEEKSDFTLDALFRIANIYERQGNPELAEKTYTRIVKEYPKTNYAEEAMFRSATVYYFQKDYSTAYRKFNDYIKKYNSGIFLEDSLYYSGDCAFKVGEINKAIMINKNLITKFPESIFSYYCYVNLLYCYYEIEDYENAYNTAAFIVGNYEDKALSDNIDSQLIELEKIVKGSDPRIVEKLTAFNDAGGVETAAGRKIGAEIVKLYGENSFTQKYGYELAVKLIENITDQDNRNDAGANAEFIGDYLRANNQNEEAGNYYLKAAEYYGEINNSIKAATVLYGAAESFSVAGLKNKSRETADLLKTLYPETKYADRVDRVVR